MTIERLFEFMDSLHKPELGTYAKYLSTELNVNHGKTLEPQSNWLQIQVDAQLNQLSFKKSFQTQKPNLMRITKTAVSSQFHQTSVPKIFSFAFLRG